MEGRHVQGSLWAIALLAAVAFGTAVISSVVNHSEAHAHPLNATINVSDHVRMPTPTHLAEPAQTSPLEAVQHIVQLMLENRSFDHMLGFLYPARSGPGGQPFEGLLGTESNNDGSGKPVTVFPIDGSGPNDYFMPGANPGEVTRTPMSSSSAGAVRRRRQPRR